MTTVDELFEACGRSGSANEFASCAAALESAGNLRLAASAYDRAYGLSPEQIDIASKRELLLSRLAVEENGIVFRYIPAGPFLMGSENGDPDESPIHEVMLSEYWMAETPLSEKQSLLFENSSIYTIRATIQQQIRYSSNADTPLVGMEPEIIDQDKVKRLSGRAIYRVPTEAEWEKAARGGLISADYPWGNSPPTASNCDFDHFNRFEAGSYSIKAMHAFAPNGYGLYAMSGGVWEWTSDLYDAEYYANSPRENPTGPLIGGKTVLRGGSWADCPEAMRVSFRATFTTRSTPTYGIRLCRVE